MAGSPLWTAALVDLEAFGASSLGFASAPIGIPLSLDRKIRRRPSQITKKPSNHEEAVRAVTGELFDETKFPVEIGLHRIS